MQQRSSHTVSVFCVQTGGEVSTVCQGFLAAVRMTDSCGLLRKCHTFISHTEKGGVGKQNTDRQTDRQCQCLLLYPIIK